MRKPTLAQQVLSQLTLLAVGLFVCLPIWGLIYMAFDGSFKGWPNEFRLWPKELTFSVIQQVWEKPAQSLSFIGLLRNSLLVSGGAAVLCVLCGLSMAYAFAQFRFPGRALGLWVLLLGAMLPPIALMTPLYLLLTALQLRTTQLGLVLVYASFAMPFCVWNMRAAFQAVPNELEEAALLEGAGHFTVFWRVTLPLAAPAIAVAALVAFLTGYTEFAFGWLFVSKGDQVTLAMAVSGMLTSLGLANAWSNVAALALLMSVPVVGLCLVLQRYLLKAYLVAD